MDGGNRTPFALVLQLILGIESIVALLGNGFIVVVNGHRWLQSRTMLPSDLLLTALGTTRFLLQMIIMIVQLLYICTWELICNTYLRGSFYFAWTYFSSASIWCATLLSVFYCVKITNFSHCLFLWLKLKIDVLVPRLLGLSLIVFSLPFAASTLSVKFHCNLMGNMTGNTSQNDESNNYRIQIFMPLLFTFIAINISICLTASILLLTSLWRHTRNLKRSSFATKDCNTQAHINAVNALLSFLLFYFLYVVVLTPSLNFPDEFGSVGALVSDVALALCPSAHSIVLILTNPKLKAVCVQVLKIRQRTS